MTDRDRTNAPALHTQPIALPTAAPLTGAGVTLRVPQPVPDADPLYQAAHGDPETEILWTWMPYGPFDGVASMRTWLWQCAASTDPAFRVVVAHGSGEPVGMAAFLNIVVEHRRLELGHIWYAPPVQRSAVNTESIYLMLMESFERLGCRRVEWKCDAANERSRAAALRLGFRFEGIFRQHMIVKGRNRDTAWFALIDADWPRARRHLERWLHGDEKGLSLTELNRPDDRS